jgi:hypothetical protein
MFLAGYRRLLKWLGRPTPNRLKEPTVRAVCRDCGEEFDLPLNSPPSCFYGYAICQPCLEIVCMGAPVPELIEGRGIILD